MPDPIYVCIAAVRIQQWISRTPKLVLNRGASRALAEKTGSDRVQRMLADRPLSGVHIAPDAPDVDGVIVLQVDDLESTTVDDVADWLRRAVADELPGVEWKAWAHQAVSYALAKAAVDQGLTSHGNWHLPPIELDIPYAHACDGCHHEYGVETKKLPGESNGAVLGPDCLDRLASSEKLTNAPRGMTFDDLARRGGIASSDQAQQTVGRRAANNHLATIAADGNRVGAVFEHLARTSSRAFAHHDRETTVQAALSKLLDEATRTAVDNAGCVGDPDAEYPSAIVHLVGGDDVLASVGARFAWEYVTALLTKFDEVFKSGLADVIEAAKGAGALNDAEADEVTKLGRGVSLGVGITFANRNHPFADCADMAHRALSQAKASGRGAAAVSWVDLTVEASVPAGRFAWPDQLGADLPTARMTPSARTTLEGILRDRWPASLTDQSQRHDADALIALWADVQKWCTRTDNAEVLEDREPADPAQIASALIALRSDLDRARWWPKPGRSGL